MSNQAPAPSPREIAAMLYEIGAVKFGRFVLQSGKISPIYMDLRVLISYPHVLKTIARAYRDLLAPLSFERLAAIPYAGLPIGVAVGLAMNRPLIYPRKEAKSYGTGKSIEGEFNPGDRVVIVEDLVTSGDSIIRGAAALKSVGLQVKHVTILIDREQGGVDQLKAQGYEVHSVMGMTYLLNLLEDLGAITGQTRTRVLNALR